MNNYFIPIISITVFNACFVANLKTPYSCLMSVETELKLFTIRGISLLRLTLRSNPENSLQIYSSVLIVGEQNESPREKRRRQA